MSEESGDRVEIRVHGIGSHRDVSALGPAVRRPAADADGPVEQFAPPPMPAHRLILINWSRASRTFAGFLWYLALPFTLVNVAGAMGSTRRRAAFSTVVAGAGLVLTFAVTIWAFATVETVVKRLPGTRWADLTIGLCVSVALAVIAGMVGRAVRLRTTGLALAHAAVVAATAALVVFWRPATVPVPRWWPGSCSTARDFDACRAVLGHTFDLVSATVVGSTAALIVLAALAWWLARRPAQPVRPTVANGPGAAFCLVVAGFWIHAVGSLVRLGVDWLLVYPTRYTAYRALGRPRCTEPPFGPECAALPPGERLLLVYTPSGAGAFPPDLVLSMIVVAGLAAAVAAVGVLLVRDRSLLAVRRSRRTWSHRLVLALPRVLPGTLVPGGLLAVGAWTFLYVEVWGPTGTHQGLYMLLTTVTHGAALAMILGILLARVSPLIRDAFGYVADVLGFWPVRLHPLAGASYRDRIVDGLAATATAWQARTTDAVVLVGHSQGSVVCAWLAAEARVTRPGLRLVTCGSPLASLYGTFFPATFDRDFFVRARANVDSWTNYWRDTDPIATALPTPSEDGVTLNIDNRRLDDTGEPPKGHSDYWTESAVTDHIAPPADASVVG